MNTVVLLHQLSVLATSLRSVHRTNVASWTDRPKPGELVGGSYRRYLSDKIISVFAKYRQLIQHIPSTLTVTNCCWSAGICAASRVITVYVGRVTCCVVLLADTACLVISDPDRLTHLQNMLPQYKQPAAPHWCCSTVCCHHCHAHRTVSLTSLCQQPQIWTQLMKYTKPYLL